MSPNPSEGCAPVSRKNSMNYTFSSYFFRFFFFDNNVGMHKARGDEEGGQLGDEGGARKGGKGDTLLASFSSLPDHAIRGKYIFYCNFFFITYRIGDIRDLTSNYFF